MPENIFELGFFHCKNVSKGSNYFPEKKKQQLNWLFFIKNAPDQNKFFCMDS